MAETENPKTKRRPIVRLGIFLISHSLLVSVVCCISGVVALLLLPVLAKNTYISENALLPGSASSMISNKDVLDANRLVKDTSNLIGHSGGIESQRLIAQYMSDLGAEVSYHKFHPHHNQFHSLNFFASSASGIIGENFSCSSYGINMVGIIRAPRGDGKEAIVLVTPYNTVTSGLGQSLSLGVAYSVFSLLTRVTWLAKDIIWLVADSRYGDHTPVAAWLRDYHTPVFSDLGIIDTNMCQESTNLYELNDNSNTEINTSDGFRRAGTMAAALVLKVADQNKQFEDTLSIYAEASNGQMPNLDLINVLVYLAVHRQGFHIRLGKLWSLLDSKWLKILGEILETLGNLAGSINPQWKFGIPATDYVDGTATLASSLYNQALGVPTGPHGAFRDYQIDAVTLEISAKFSSASRGRQNDFILRGGRLIEGVIRSVNNLLEKFHQSFFLYLLTAPTKFVSVGVYMIAFGLLVAPLPMVAASLYSGANDLNPSFKDDGSTPQATAEDDELDVMFRQWKWLNGAKNVFVIQVWGAIVSFFPYFISQIPDCTSTTSLLIWVLLSVFSLLFLYLILGSFFHLPQTREVAILKSVTISAAFIGLCLMSIINFATAEFGALMIVPMCLLSHPLKLDLRAKSLRNFSRAICNLVLGFVGFPPTAFFLLKVIFEGFSGVNVGDLWNWVESLWAWNSATYLYICMVHLPCWVLCIYILLHSC
ncbi:Gaa1 domain-containing protein [Cephalotus follicularis]|uniref:Gaa1 domain-containing protein n=1 Tax=Cephalotus follicularis TaxID=3775 RepID=A0A1Q3BQ90_CEPFO|nr:Gaa1 domain-containing protein [Cephalotus follicularis]